MSYPLCRGLHLAAVLEAAVSSISFPEHTLEIRYCVEVLLIDPVLALKIQKLLHL